MYCRLFWSRSDELCSEGPSLKIMWSIRICPSIIHQSLSLKNSRLKNSRFLPLLERPIWPSFGARCTILWGGLWSASTGPFRWLPRTIILGCREPVGGRRSGIPGMPYMSVGRCVLSEGLSAWQDVFTRWVAVLDFRCLTSAMELAHLAVELHVESFLLRLIYKEKTAR